MLCVFYFIFYLCSKSVLAPCTWYRRVLDFKLYLRSISCAWLKDVLDIDLYLTSSYSCIPPCKISRSAEVSLALVTLETLLKIKNKLQMDHIEIVSRCAWRFYYTSSDLHLLVGELLLHLRHDGAQPQRVVSVQTEGMVSATKRTWIESQNNLASCKKIFDDLMKKIVETKSW